MCIVAANSTRTLVSILFGQVSDFTSNNQAFVSLFDFHHWISLNMLKKVILSRNVPGG